MITPEPPAGSEHYREGWRHGYEQAAIDRERSADAVRAAPDTGQARLSDSSCRSLLRQVDEIRLLRVEPWEETNAEHIASVIERHALAASAVPAEPTSPSGDTGQAREPDEDVELARRARFVRAWWSDWPTPRRAAVRVLSSHLADALDDLRDPSQPLIGIVPPTLADEPSADTVQAPDLAALADRIRSVPPMFSHLDGSRDAVYALVAIERDLRALLGTDTTPDAGRG